MFNNLRTRLTLLFVPLTIIPLVIVAAAIASQGSQTLENQTVELQEQVARQTAISLGAFFNERQNELVVLTEVYGLETLDETTQRDVLLTLLSAQPAYYQLALAEPDGQETLRLTRGEAVTTAELASRADDAVFQEALETREVSISSIYFDQNARDRLLTMVVPVDDLFTGEIGYLLIADLRFRSVGETTLRELNITDEDEDVYVLDNSGVVIAHRDPNIVIGETVFDLPEIQGRTTGLTGSDVILATSTLQLQNQQLSVVAEKSYAKATALAADLTRLATTVSVVALLAAIVVIILGVSQVVRPIRKMAHVAEAIQDGDLSARADETGATEIATLGSAFNGMTAQLQQTLQGLQANVTQLEESNAQRQKLIVELQTAKRLAEEGSRLKSEFLSTMSHELRTPMNAIEGFTGIMLRRMAGVEFNDKTERYLQKVRSNSTRLLGLINDFLDLSRIESGRLELAYLPISVSEMAQRWKSELDVLAESKNIDFKLSIDPELPEIVYGDEEALSKIVTNLLGNAFKFTSEGQVTLALERNDGQMVIEVADTGIGIPPHAREFIFDEFRQVDQTSKRKYGGTGLGLAIVQKLARAMEGTVTLESEVGQGSTFTVMIPIRTEETEA